MEKGVAGTIGEFDKAKSLLGTEPFYDKRSFPDAIHTDSGSFGQRERHQAGEGPEVRVLIAVVRLLAKQGVPLIEDDIYGDIYFGAERP
jgi:hypothetical protein